MGNSVKEVPQTEVHAQIMINREGKVFICDIWKNNGLKIEDEDLSEQIVNSLPEDFSEQVNRSLPENIRDKGLLLVFGHREEEIIIHNYSVLTENPQRMTEEELTLSISTERCLSPQSVLVSKDGRILEAPQPLMDQIIEYEVFFDADYRFPVEKIEETTGL